MRHWILLELSHFGNKRSSCVLNGENKLCLFYCATGVRQGGVFVKYIVCKTYC